MSLLLDFFTGGPARIKGLLVGAMAIGALCLSLAGWAWIEHLGAALARAERDRALDQVAVISAAAMACTASVEHVKQARDAAVAAGAAAQKAARLVKAPVREIVVRTNTIIERGLTPEQAASCDWAWGRIEADRATKAKGAP